MGYAPRGATVESLTFTIANGASVSDGKAVNGKGLVAIQMPAGWTAASLTIQHSLDGGLNYSDVYDNTGTEYTITVAAGRYVVVKVPNGLESLTFIRFRSGTAGAPVTQGAQRILTAITRALF